MKSPDQIHERIKAIQQAMPTANPVEYAELRGRLTEIAYITNMKVYVPERRFASKIIKNELAKQ